MRRTFPSVPAATCSRLLTSIPISPFGRTRATGCGSYAMDRVVPFTVTAPTLTAVAIASTMFGVSCISMVCLYGDIGNRSTTRRDARSDWFGASDRLHQKPSPYMTQASAPWRRTGFSHLGRRAFGSYARLLTYARTIVSHMSHR